MVGGLARDARANDPWIVRRQLEEHLPGVAHPHVADSFSVDVGMKSHVAQDGQLIFVLEGSAIHEVHALTPIDDERPAAVKAQLDFAAVAPPGTGVTGVEQAIHHVGVSAQPRTEPLDPATTVSVGEKDEGELPVVRGSAQRVGRRETVEGLCQVDACRPTRAGHLLNEKRLREFDDHGGISLDR